MCSKAFFFFLDATPKTNLPSTWGWPHCLDFVQRYIPAVTSDLLNHSSCLSKSIRKDTVTRIPGGIAPARRNALAPVGHDTVTIARAGFAVALLMERIAHRPEPGFPGIRPHPIRARPGRRTAGRVTVELETLTPPDTVV
jgi:hypothetical protein